MLLLAFILFFYFFIFYILHFLPWQSPSLCFQLMFHENVYRDSEGSTWHLGHSCLLYNTQPLDYNNA